MVSTVSGEVVARRPVIELDVLLIGAPPVRSVGVGDLMQPHRVTFRFDLAADGSAGNLLYPVTITGPPSAAREGGPPVRHVTYTTAGLTPAWLLVVARQTLRESVTP